MTKKVLTKEDTIKNGNKVIELLKKFKLESSFKDYPQFNADAFILKLSHNIGFRVCADRFIQLQLDGYSIESRKELKKFRKDLETLDRIIVILEKNGFKVGL